MYREKDDGPGVSAKRFREVVIARSCCASQVRGNLRRSYVRNRRALEPRCKLDGRVPIQHRSSGEATGRAATECDIRPGMGSHALVKSHLENVVIDDGERLLKALEATGEKVPSAFWLHDEETNYWRLILALTSADEEGPAPAYSRINAVIKKISAPFAIRLDDIGVWGPNESRFLRLRSLAGRGSDIPWPFAFRVEPPGKLYPGTFVYTR